jgi:hypothetical protein
MRSLPGYCYRLGWNYRGKAAVGKGKKVISLVWIIGIQAMIFGVALIVLSFRARGRYQASISKVGLRQSGPPLGSNGQQ